MSLAVYLVARFSRLPELREHRDEIETRGHTVVSRWLDGGHEWTGTPDEQIPPKHQARFAIEDMEDIDACDVLVAFTEPSGSGPARGGRHVELGYALGKGKRVVVVDHYENVFCCHPDVIFAEGLGDVLCHLDLIAEQTPQPTTPPPGAQVAADDLANEILTTARRMAQEYAEYLLADEGSDLQDLREAQHEASHEALGRAVRTLYERAEMAETVASAAVAYEIARSGLDMALDDDLIEAGVQFGISLEHYATTRDALIAATDAYRAAPTAATPEPGGGDDA